MTTADPDPTTPAPAEPEQLQEQPSQYEPAPSGGSSKLVRVLGLLVIIAGVIMIVAGVFTWVVVQTQLDDENITVSEDADRFAGDPVDGPLTAYAEADVIETHALEASGGLTYAELDARRPRPGDGDDGVVPAVVAVHVHRRLRRGVDGSRARRRADPHRHRPAQDLRSVTRPPARRTGSSVDGGTSAAKKSPTMRATSTGRSSGTACEEPGRIDNCPAGSAS